MAKLSLTSAFNTSLCKLYQLNTSLFLCIPKCKQKENNRKKIPASKNKKYKQTPQPTNPTLKHVYIYVKCIPLQNKLSSSACNHDLTNALELLGSYSIFQERIRRACESHKPGNCMQIANLPKTERFGKILSHAQLNPVYIMVQLHIT